MESKGLKMANESTAPKRLTSASNSKLPMASELPDTDDLKRVVKLMKEANALKVKISEAEDRLDEIKQELSAVCEVYNMKGFRHGLNAFEYHGWITRKALNKEKLATLVPADVIDSCYEPGPPFLSVRVIAFDME
jgi:hypothetical protein